MEAYAGRDPSALGVLTKGVDDLPRGRGLGHAWRREIYRRRRLRRCPDYAFHGVPWVIFRTTPCLCSHQAPLWVKRTFSLAYGRSIPGDGR